MDDFAVIYVEAPRHIVPEGHIARVKIVKAQVPTGSTLFYLMDKPESWQIGLWQRSRAGSGKAAGLSS